LLEAVKNNDQDMVKLLLKHGSNPDIPNKDGLTAAKIIKSQPAIWRQLVKWVFDWRILLPAGTAIWAVNIYG
jgi:hypothetical protein